MTQNEYSLILIIVAIFAALSAGCIAPPEDPFPGEHGGIKGHIRYCDVYYENITVVAKNVEIHTTGFGSESAYVIAVKEDDVQREAVDLKLYTLMEVNRSYHVEEVDRKGCGRSYHSFIILGAVPI